MILVFLLICMRIPLISSEVCVGWVVKYVDDFQLDFQLAKRRTRLFSVENDVLMRCILLCILTSPPELEATVHHQALRLMAIQYFAYDSKSMNEIK
jgi:hypothetical protein